MDQPKVVAICLTADRQLFTDRAVRCFEAQDYENAQLLILDSGKLQWNPGEFGFTPKRAYYRNMPAPIGTLRNIAVRCAANDYGAQVILHFDSDDYSGPTRISTQVKHLQESGAAAVGYREMLFWVGSVPCPVCNAGSDDDGAECPSCGNRRWVTGTRNGAWMYHNTDPRYIVGTSLCYWVSSWEAARFPDCQHGEDNEFLKRLRAAGKRTEGAAFDGSRNPPYQPRDASIPLIAELHGGNTMKQHIYPEARNTDGSPQWRRMEAWDSAVKALLEGA